MKLETSYVCLNEKCHEIQDGAKTGKCEACGSDHIFALGWLLRTKEERQNWIDKVFGQISAPGTGGRP